MKNVDREWMDHIDAMEELQKGIRLRAYGQRDPVVEYRLEGFDMFDEMIATIRENTARMMLTVQLRTQEEPEARAGGKSRPLPALTARIPTARCIRVRRSARMIRALRQR